MNPMSSDPVCAYCQEVFLAERMVIRGESLLLVLHPWCVRSLGQDLAKSFDSWYVAKYFSKSNQPAMRENQTPEPTDDQYGPFTEEEFDTLLLRACKHGATDEEMTIFLNWATKSKINATLLDLIQRGDLEISGYKDDGTFVMKLPGNLP
jgi:hypothetical protein